MQLELEEYHKNDIRSHTFHLLLSNLHGQMPIWN